MKLLAAAASGALVLCAFSYSAQAAVFYTQDFEDPAFKASNTTITPDSTSDRYAVTNYYNIVSTDGWSFGGNLPALAVGVSGVDQTNSAVLVNEPSGFAVTVQTPQGIAGAGQTYTVGFTYWGDNRPGQSWGLNVTINGVTTALTGVDGTAGQYPLGFSAVLTGIADANGELNINFAQNSPSGSEASPIFDDVYISDGTSSAGATPLPAALPMFGAGLGLLGFIARRRKQKNAAAVAA